MNHYNNELVADMTRLGTPLDTEGNKILFNQVMAGDADARERMIEGNMSLVVDKVSAIISSYPTCAHLRDDLTSAGFIGLTKAVNAIAEGRVSNANVTGYLAIAIGRELSNLLDTENLIYVRGNTRRVAKARGREIASLRSSPLPEFHEQSYDLCGEMELRDLLQACCTNEKERTFLSMREAGHTYTEIAAAIGVSTASVYRLSRALGTRVQDKLESLQ